MHIFISYKTKKYRIDTNDKLNPIFKVEALLAKIHNLDFDYKSTDCFLLINNDKLGKQDIVDFQKFKDKEFCLIKVNDEKLNAKTDNKIITTSKLAEIIQKVTKSKELLKPKNSNTSMNNLMDPFPIRFDAEMEEEEYSDYYEESESDSQMIFINNGSRPFEESFADSEMESEMEFNSFVPDEDMLRRLLEMGFPLEISIEALIRSRNVFDLAIEILMMLPN